MTRGRVFGEFAVRCSGVRGFAGRAAVVDGPGIATGIAAHIAGIGRLLRALCRAVVGIRRVRTSGRPGLCRKRSGTAARTGRIVSIGARLFFDQLRRRTASPSGFMVTHTVSPAPRSAGPRKGRLTFQVGGECINRPRKHKGPEHRGPRQRGPKARLAGKSSVRREPVDIGRDDMAAHPDATVLAIGGPVHMEGCRRLPLAE